MIKVVESDLRTRTNGFGTVREIVRRRVPEVLLPQDALDLAVEKTGGVLQHLFEVLHIAASMTDYETETDPITVERIEYGLQRKRREFYQEIAIPFGGVQGEPHLKVQDLYDRLAEYARAEEQGKKNKPPTDAINQVLLKCCALVEYNGEGWFGVHPLVFDVLREQALL